MKRSAGVTVIAVLSLIGSVLTLLIGILVLAAMAFVPPPAAKEYSASPVALKVIFVCAALAYILPAVWGIITSIGLFRLVNWARMSIIVFSVLLVLVSGFSVLAALLMPTLSPSSGASPGSLRAVQAVMGVFWLALLGMGVWWLVFFTRPRVRQEFLPEGWPGSRPTPEILTATAPESSPMAMTVRAPERPVSLTVIAWFLLIGCVFMPLNLFLRFPAVLLTKLVTGWSAALYYVILTVVSLYVGIGLLRFKPYARETGIAYFLFLVINTASFYFVPGGRGRMRALLDAQSGIFPWMRFGQPQPQLQSDLMVRAALFGGTIGLIFMAVPLYFLITRKEAFAAAARSR